MAPSSLLDIKEVEEKVLLEKTDSYMRTVFIIFSFFLFCIGSRSFKYD